MKITTWNINSVRLRMPIVKQFLKSHAPDILCLQETKCRDSEFPSGEFKKLGYEHIAISGQKGYHGVAIVSKLPFAATSKRDFCTMGDARHICVEFRPVEHRPIHLHNFYVPAGGDEPDPAINPKFKHKLAFLDELAEWIKTERIARAAPILVGDLNIAPLETGRLESQGAFESREPHADRSRKARRRLRRGAVDRRDPPIVPKEEKLFTWWSYRAADWAASDRGRRLDHIWVGESLGRIWPA